MASVGTDKKAKSVLVCLNENKREVSFPEGLSVEEEKKEFLDAVHSVFSDLLPASPPAPLTVQVKSEEWDGEFIDIGNETTIQHHSVVKVIPSSASKSANVS